MDVERIRELRLAYPFKPFKLMMEDGRDIRVVRPLQLGISPDRSIILVLHDDQYDTPEFFSPSRVKDAIVLEDAGKTPRN